MRFRIRLRKVEVLFQPLKIVGTHIPHIFIPHPTLEWPTEAWNSQFLFPTNENIPSPLLSLPLFHTSTITQTRSILDPGGITHDASVCKDVSFGSPVSFRYESRILNWTGGGKRNNEGERRGRGGGDDGTKEEISPVISAIRP